MKVAQVSANTAPLVTSRMTMSLRRMGRCSSAMRLAAPRPLRYAQQLRAEHETCRPGCLLVDAQLYVLVHQHEADDAAALVEAVQVAHGEHDVPFDTAQDLRQLPALGRADVENVTAGRAADALRAAHRDRPAVHPLTRD